MRGRRCRSLYSGQFSHFSRLTLDLVRTENASRPRVKDVPPWAASSSNLPPLGAAARANFKLLEWSGRENLNLRPPTARKQPSKRLPGHYRLARSRAGSTANFL